MKKINIKKICLLILVTGLVSACISGDPINQDGVKNIAPLALCQHTLNDKNYKIATKELNRRQISLNDCAKLMSATAQEKTAKAQQVIAIAIGSLMALFVVEEIF